MPPPFKGYHIVTQEDLLPPTIMNMVVYSIICHWVMVVAVKEAGAKGLGASIQYLAEYFYSDN